MQTYLNFKQQNKAILPKQFHQNDVRYADDFVKYCLNEFSEPGDIVFDPVVGCGTTLLIAQEMDRKTIKHYARYIDDVSNFNEQRLENAIRANQQIREELIKNDKSNVV